MLLIGRVMLPGLLREYIGKPFANFLMKHNCKVYEINPFITKSWRSALSANGNKNDYGDAKVISIFSKNLKLEEVSLKTVELKEKITARGYNSKNIRRSNRKINSSKNIHGNKRQINNKSIFCKLLCNSTN